MNAARIGLLISVLVRAGLASAQTLPPGSASPRGTADPGTTVTALPGLVAFWEFQEPAGQPRVSRGPRPLALQEMKGPIERVEGGVFGPHAARIQRGQWLMIPRADIGPLDIHGRDAQVTVVAWVRREDKSSWQAIAGVWDETRKKRQYCLFLNAPRGTRADEMKRYPLANRIHGHVSAIGGPTPGEPFCITYSSGATEIPLHEWHCLAMRYDGRESRVYVNGRLDALEHYNPFPYPDGLFDGGPDGADFTVGAVHRGGEWGNFFGGRLGGLAVFNRALTDDELAWLARIRPAAGAAAHFRILGVSPGDGADGVPVTAAIQAHLSERFDPATIGGDTVRLWRGPDRVPVRVTGDLGGVVTISPEAPLAPGAEYRVELTAGLRSASGAALKPFESRFRTGKPVGPATRTLPPFRRTKIGVAPGMTALALGPDGSLYAATWEGQLLRWRLDPATGRPRGDATLLWHPPKTRVTGLRFDPDAARNRRLWVALDDNAGASVCELRFTARIVRLTLPERDGGAVEVEEFITGLPVGDHAVSGLVFGPDGRLYFFCGAITMLGGDKPGARETPLSAAVLAADVRAADFPRNGPVNVNTDPPHRYDPRAPGAPVKLFATGVREAYGLCWHSNGQLYAGVNQNDTAEYTPAHPARGLPAVNARPDEPLIRIAAGKYYGHPNPSRDEWVLMGGNPTAGADPWEVPQLPAGTKPEPHFDPSLLIYNLVPIGGQSANGCAEWRGPGPLRGRLLICFYTSARTVHTFAFSADGTRVLAEEPLADGKGAPLKFGGPLDLVIDDANGRLYVADFADWRRRDSAGEGALWLVEPVGPAR